MRLVGVVLLFAVPFLASEYTQSVEKWRQERETRLKSPDNWLSVAGLFWLKPGENTVGSHPSSRVTLPKKSPARAGVFTLAGDVATFRPASGRPVTLTANSDQSVSVGGVKLSILHRGSRYGVRIRDNNSEYRTKFTKLDWYPIDPTWRIDAKYIPLPKPRTTFFDYRR